MRRRFNTAGFCIPKNNYMVKLDERLRKMKEDEGRLYCFAT